MSEVNLSNEQRRRSLDAASESVPARAALDRSEKQGNTFRRVRIAALEVPDGRLPEVVRDATRGTAGSSSPCAMPC
jgi:hypothetical protein